MLVPFKYRAIVLQLVIIAGRWYNCCSCWWFITRIYDFLIQPETFSQAFPKLVIFWRLATTVDLRLFALFDHPISIKKKEREGHQFYTGWRFFFKSDDIPAQVWRDFLDFRPGNTTAGANVCAKTSENTVSIGFNHIEFQVFRVSNIIDYFSLFFVHILDSVLI